MKKITIITLAAIAIALAACTPASEALDPGLIAPGTVPAVINTSIAPHTATRATRTEPGTGTLPVKTQFNPGDEITISYFNGQRNKGIFATYDGTRWNTDGDFYINTSGNQAITASYDVLPTHDTQTGITTYYDELYATATIVPPATDGEPYTVSFTFTHVHNLLTVNLLYTDGTTIHSDAPIHIYTRISGYDEEKLATGANRQCIVPNSSYILRATTTLPDGRQINATTPGDGIRVNDGTEYTLNITVGPLNATLSIGQNDIPGWEEKTGTVNP